MVKPIFFRSDLRHISFCFIASFFYLLCFTTGASYAQNKELATQAGNEFGVVLSNYRYTEPGVMNLKATKIGFEYSGTYVIEPEWPKQNEFFLKTEIRYATGQANYDSLSSGYKSNVPDWYYEAKVLVGKDYSLDGYTLSPYVGLGYRYLFNDLRGTTTANKNGYRRESNYYSMPIGLTHKLSLTNQKQLQTNIEYSHLLRGLQKSKLSDINTANQDVNNIQLSGYGLRFSSMVRFGTWTIGPSLMYWSINQSEETIGLVEPKNNTTEIGFHVNYFFK